MEPDLPNAGLGSLPADLDQRLARLSILQEPLRRALYLYVAAQPGEVGRDQAAEAMGIRRGLAAFHLDKLAHAGLLDVGYRRLSGRSGPGAGRPAKLYRTSPEGHDVSLPPRAYELAARLLATGIEHAGEGSTRDAVQEAAEAYGRTLGQECRERLGACPGRQRQLQAVEDILSRFGFQPRLEAGAVRLGNCPFHSLAREHTDLACGMNLALVRGVVAGLGAGGLRASLEPRPEGCCVVLRQLPRTDR